ncbi:subtilisin-like protein [Byssothecium circinans]|uniref:Subtilisin-like protein n=1 Tax=Byssothecium circinans TaxID=147558 RepID=A0A6A5THX1_9PLEO|nr:subtilisin-like protein [Byssothecium circinans]
MPTVKRKKSLPPPTAPKPAHFQTRKPKPRAPTRHTVAPLKFFDTIDKPEQRQISGAARWFGYFEQERVQNQLPKPANKKNERIKIAVLDTGIDLENPWIYNHICKIRCRPNEIACKDIDAKVTKSQYLDDADIGNIADAIRHFATENDRVDIINLSFGFPKYDKRLKPIREAVQYARAKNVLIFAAAGNEGGNHGMFWPAKLHEVGDVISIHASDSDGNASSFNPTPGLGGPICTLGEAVPSCELDERNLAVHRSSTSFATPIAVAIAAIVLGFVGNVGMEGVPEDFESLKERLRTKAGMERVLRTTCVLADEKRRAKFSYITPWFLLDIEECSRIHIIANELRGIPE